MSRVALFVAIAALLVMVGDFIRTSAPRLERRGELLRQMDEALALHEERLERDGVPPEEAELATVREAARETGERTRTTREEYFAGARAWSDYLFPRRARPARTSPTEVRNQLIRELSSLRDELRDWPVIHLGDLGLRFPGAREPIPSDPAVLADQIPRLLQVRWLLSGIRTASAPELISVRLSGSGRTMTTSVEVVGGVMELVSFLERFLAPDEALPPRQLVTLDLRRLEPVEWGPGTARFDGPPLAMRLSTLLENPGKSPEAGRPR